MPHEQSFSGDWVDEQYTPEFIFKTMGGTEHCANCSIAEDGTINTRIMSFACDPELRRFYFMTHKAAPKLADYAKNPSVSVLVFSMAKDLGDFSETAAKGKLSVHSDFNSPAVQEGLRLLGEKNRMAKAIADKGSLGDYVVLELLTSEISFRIFRDIMKNVPKTTIKY